MSLFSAMGRFLGIGEAPPQERPVRFPPSEGAVFGSGFTVKGEVSGDGDLQIMGRFEGQISLTGAVLVGEGAEVDANIFAGAIVIGGSVRGNLSATGRVEILPTGVLTGTLKSGSLSAAEGASVKGEVWVERSPSSVGATGGTGSLSGLAQ
jgi:cytoskeletal protein CcmA (bactofilin family)